MSDPLDRDDVVAAVFATQINKGLKYIDEQTTSRPLQTPPASRLKPKELLRTGHPQVQVGQSGPVQPTEIVDSSPLFEPEPLKNILIPLPEGVNSPELGPAIVNPIAVATPAPPSAQLELPLQITPKKKPETGGEWFQYLDEKIDKVALDIEMRQNRIINLLNELVSKKRHKKILKNSKVYVPGSTEACR